MNLDSSEINETRAEYLKTRNDLENCRILDVGGGTNSSHKFFKNLNYSILDPQDPVGDQIDHIKGLISNTNLPEQYFDYIFAFHIFEHLENPRNDLRKLSACLKKNGRIFVEVPECNYYARNLPYYLFFHQHISLFTTETLDKLFSYEGFQKIETSIDGGRLLVTYEKSSHKLTESDPNKSLVNPIIGKDKRFFQSKEWEVLRDLENLGPGEVVFLGAGGSTTLLLYHFPQVNAKVDSFMDNDIRKIGLDFPGTTKKIKQMTRGPEEGKIYLSLGEAILVNWGNVIPDKFLDIKSYFDREEK